LVIPVPRINSKNFLSTIKQYWPCLLVLLAFIGFISKSLYNYPIGIMALLGLYKIILTPRILIQDQILKIFTLVFLCLWLPLLISFPDAVNPEHSAHTIFPYLRFFFAGIFVIHEISKDNDRLKFIIAGLFYIVFFWCIDATIQFAFNKNLLGFPYEPGHITGMFYPRNTISHICSILSAFCFLYIYINLERKKWLIISLAPLFFIILLSGRRAAWVMLALSSFGFFIYGYNYSKNKTRFIKVTGILVTLLTLLLSTTIIYHEPTSTRFKVTLGLFSNDYDSINRATAVRLPIWETSYAIFKSNPVNGIGPRGFRHIYKDYAPTDDYFVRAKVIPTQPHILILEILAETGLIGFLGYLLALFLIVKITRLSNNREDLSPFLIPVFVALFPFNTHMAFYGSIWSSMSWLLLFLFFTKANLIIGNDRFVK
jgi:O-antigen ligase